MNARWRAASGAGRLVARGVAALVVFALAVPVAGADGARVAMRDDGFDPPLLTVAVGEPVTWTNDTEMQLGVVATDGSFESGQLDPGASFTHVFTTPGTIDYFAGGNPRLRATVIVQAAAATPGPSGSHRPTAPAATPSPTPSPVASTPPPTATPTPIPTPSPSAPAASPAPSPAPTATPTPAPASSTGDGGPWLMLAVVAVAVIAVGAAIVGLVAAAGRSERSGR